MKQICTILIWIIAILPLSAENFINYQKVAEKVRDKLIIVYGNHKIEAPAIKITRETLPIAIYKSRKKQIILEYNTFKFCSQFGKDSLDVLAFIIGHELSHHYRKKRGKFGFAKDCLVNTSLTVKAEERQADIWGAFGAFLAGYKTIELLPQIIEGLYQTFNLDKKLKDYPSFQEREKTDLFVFSEVQKMIELHKAAVWLSALGKYDLAAANYEYIAQFYPSREIYNNIGVNYALQAMNFTGEAIDKFIYPLELDWSTRLSLIKKSRGENELSIGEKEVRKNFLEKAIKAFQRIKKLDKSYLHHQLNLINTYALLGKGVNNYAYPKKGIRLYERLLRQGLLEKSELKTQFQMAYALACFRSNQRLNVQKGIEVLQSLTTDKKQLLAEQAAFNLKALDTKKEDLETTISGYNCPKELSLLTYKDEEDVIYRSIAEGEIILTDTIAVGLKQDSGFLNFTYEKSGTYNFLLERQISPKINRKIIPTLNPDSSCKWIAVNTGGFLISIEHTSGLLLSKDYQVIEAIKFYQVKE